MGPPWRPRSTWAVFGCGKPLTWTRRCRGGPRRPSPAGHRSRCASFTDGNRKGHPLFGIQILAECALSFFICAFFCFLFFLFPEDYRIRRWTLHWWDLHAVTTTCGGWRWPVRGWRHMNRRCRGRRRRRRSLICGERTAKTSSMTTVSTTPSSSSPSTTRRWRARNFDKPSAVVAGRRRWRSIIHGRPGPIDCLGPERSISSYFGEMIRWMANGLVRLISTTGCTSSRVCLGCRFINEVVRRTG